MKYHSAMKKNCLPIILIMIIGLSVIILLTALLWLNKNPYEKKQMELANRLGVTIEDYPYESAFPEGYFFTVLKPGMTSSDVHEIIYGFEKVLYCGKYSEIYYYYNTDDLKALRFEIIYDGAGRFVELRSEDDDSRTIRTEGCVLGLIPEE